MSLTKELKYQREHLHGVSRIQELYALCRRSSGRGGEFTQPRERLFEVLCTESFVYLLGMRNSPFGATSCLFTFASEEHGYDMARLASWHCFLAPQFRFPLMTPSVFVLHVCRVGLSDADGISRISAALSVTMTPAARPLCACNILS